MGLESKHEAAPMVLPLTRLSEPRTALAIEEKSTGDADRGELVQFVREVFQSSYGASIHSFYPHLVGLRRPDNELAAVAGVRPALAAPLFCEGYLDAPIEQLISKTCGQPVTRDQIVEVGNLAPASVGQARWLIATVTAYLHSAGFRWVVFTAVPKLHNAFRRMALNTIPLADADPNRLAAGAKDEWGSYYANRPVVYAGNILQGFHDLSHSVDPHFPELFRLWNAAMTCGQAAGKRFSETRVARAS